MFLIFWGPKWTDSSQPDYSTYQDIIFQEGQLFNNLAGSGYKGILTQYSDSGGPVFNNLGDDVLQDIVEDSTTPPSSIDQTAEATEINNVAQQISNWPFVQDKMVILMPQEGSTYTDTSLTSTIDCAYHYVTNDGNNNLYAMLPYLTDASFSNRQCVGLYGDSSASDRLAAAMTVLASHEFAETVTDPWANNANTRGWVDQQGANEIGDLCAPEYFNSTTLTTDVIWVQDLWDNSDYSLDSTKGCVAESVVFVPNPSTYVSSVFAEYAGIYGTAALNADDIWAVGYCACNGYYQTLEEHYDGSSWTVAANPR